MRPPTSVIPQSMLAYVMTDVAGSTELWERDEAKMAQALGQLDCVCEETFEQAHGTLLKERGEGDSHFGVFGKAEDAIRAATSLLLAIRTDPALKYIVLRVGIHLGAAESWSGDYYGPVVNRCARIRQAAQPGQILTSEAVHAVAAAGREFGFKDLGLHRLRDLMQPERLFQVLHPDLPHEFPRPNTLSALSHNLPSYLSSFVGRQTELDALSDTIKQNRLVTVTGPGGVGKTRLTQQVAAELIEQFKDGVWFIDLAQTERPESVLPILCKELELGADATESSLVDGLKHRRLLLILDNCEHLFAECRRVASHLLQQCPEVSILATSRRILDVRGEFVFRLGGLALPPPDQLADAPQFDAIRLFVERSKQRGTPLAVDAQSIPPIVDLCAKLDGLPLALEMAASLTDVLSIAEIARSISEYIPTSVGFGSEDFRHQTIARTIEWSRRLLTPEGQVLLNRVSFFPSTWTLEGACAVCFPAEKKLTVRDLLRELLNHSLVYSLRTRTDDLRFGLLQTTRQVILNDTGAQDDLVPPYVDYCHALIKSAQDLIDGGEESRAHQLLELEWETLIKALDLSFTPHPQRCAEMALGLRPFWMSGTRLPEGKSWYLRLSASQEIDASTRGSLLVALSSICILLGENDLAYTVLLSAEETVSPLGGMDLARVIGNLAVHQDRLGRYPEAKEGFERCCALFRECGARREEALSLLNIGVAKLRLNEPLSECADYYHQALACARGAGLISLQAKAFSCLAHVELRQGALSEALELNRQALLLWLEDLVIPDCVLAMLDLAEIYVSLERFESSTMVILVADRLVELSQSPFPSLHQARLEASRKATKVHATPMDWRTGSRQTKSKSAHELVSLVLQTIAEA